MMLLELLVPKGSLSRERRRKLAERLVTEVISGDGVPTAIVERTRVNTQVVVREPDVWMVGAQPVGPADSLRFILRVSVPGGHLDEAMRAELVARLTRAIASEHPEPQRVYDEPIAWIFIDEVPDGHIGTFGHVVRTSDIIKWNVTGNRPATNDQLATAQPPADAIDPICGMRVSLTPTALTLDHDGTTYAFCSTSCRGIFAAQHGIALQPT